MKIIAFILYIVTSAVLYRQISTDYFFIGTCIVIAGLAVNAGLFLNGEKIDTYDNTPRMS